MIRKAIPNIITCLNLLCGIMAIAFSSTTEQGGETQTVAFAGKLIFLAAFLDFIDGYIARLLNAQSEFGKQLDSLADAVTFGVAPSFVLYFTFFSMPRSLDEIKPAGLAYLLPVFAILRLAKFNIDKSQRNEFKGLPTPAMAIFFASLPIVINAGKINDVILNNAFLIVTTISFSALMVATLPMFSLKFKHYRWKENETRYIFLLLSLILLIAFREIGIPLIIILYILLSLFIFVYKKFLSSNN